MNNLTRAIFLALVAVYSVASVEAADLPLASATGLPVSSPASGTTLIFTPYLWAAGLKGTVALGPLTPPVNVDQSFTDILGHMKMGFMGTFELRNQKIGLLADINYLHVAVSASGPSGFTDGHLNEKTFFGTFAGTYRFAEQAHGWIDVTAGTRIWWRETDLSITAPGPVGLDVQKEKSWIDPVIGLRARTYLMPQYFAQISGDYGGFSVGAKSDWQIEGIVGYEFSTTKSMFIGYRHLEVDYDKNGYRFDVKLSGPIIGGSFKF